MLTGLAASHVCRDCVQIALVAFLCRSVDLLPGTVLGLNFSGAHAGRVNADLLTQAPESLKARRPLTCNRAFEHVFFQDGQVLMSGPDPLCKMVGETFLELGRQDA